MSKMDKVKKHFSENYFNDEIKNNIERGVLEKIKGDKVVYLTPAKRKKNQKWFKMSGAAVVAFGVLFGSGFLSPTMASMFAKIPYFEHLFQQDVKEIPDLFMIVEEGMSEKGFERIGQSYRTNSKKLEVFLPVSKSEFEQVKSKAKDTVESVMKDNKIDGFKVTVHQDEQGYQASIRNGDISPMLEKEMKLMKELESKGFAGVLVTLENKEANVANPISKNYNKSEIEEEVKTLLSENGLSEYKLLVDPMDDVITEEEKQKGEWSKIIMPLDVGLSTTDGFKYQGVSYADKSGTFILYINTSLDKNEVEKAKELELLVEEFIQKAKVPEKTNHFPYDVVVNGKDNKEIK